jgi:hypothetical protein
MRGSVGTWWLGVALVGCHGGETDAPGDTEIAETGATETDSPVETDSSADEFVPALVNGYWNDGFSGWTADGGASDFHLYRMAEVDRRAVTTFATDGDDLNEACKGRLYQDFVVPEDAIAMRFTVGGGHARVALLDPPTDETLKEASGTDAHTLVPISWGLATLRGQTVRVTVDDAVDDSWGFVNTSGFDVVRDKPSVIVDGDFAADLDGWRTTGQADEFRVFVDQQYFGIRVLTTNSSDDLAATQGTLYQHFDVPEDAIALRFVVTGGRARVRLYDGAIVLYETTGPSSMTRIPVSWDLQPYQGYTVTLSIEDDVDEPWGFINVSAFDLITATNGP